MPGSATDQLKALVEAAEREARESREGLDRVGERADVLARRLDDLTAGVADALEALRDEIAALRAAGEAPTVAQAPPAAPEAEPAPAEPAPPEPVPEAGAVPEGARLLALKMALDGRPRAETAAYLRDNFDLHEPESLLDEVYARAEARK